MPIDSITHPGSVGFIISTPLMALAGVVAVLIPLIIHLLFRRRRRPMQWAAMQFIIQAWAARRRRVRMEQWILLTLRCLVPLILGLALAQPLLGDSSWLGGSTHRYIVIDNGVATSAISPGGETDFELIREQASNFIRSSNHGDRVTIIETTRPLAPTHPTSDPEQAADHIESIQQSFLESNLETTLRGISRSIENQPGDESHELIVFSPFRSGSIRTRDASELEFPTGTTLRFSSPATDPLENIRFTSIEPLRRFMLRDPGEIESGQASLGRTATATIVRDGTTLEEREISISASTNGGTTHRTYGWKTGQQEAEVEIQLPPVRGDEDSPTIKVTIDTVDANPIDNTWYLSMDMVERIRFLILDRPSDGFQGVNQSRWLEFALNPGELDLMEVQVMDPMAIMTSDLEDLDVLVVARPDLLQDTGIDLVDSFKEQNGIVLLFPPADQEIHHWTTMVQEKLDLPWQWNQEVRTHDEPMGLRGSDASRRYLAPIAGDLPVLLESIRVMKSLELDPSSDANVLLTLEDGSPLLVVTNPGEDGSGTIIHTTTPMDPAWTDLPTKPLMVPLFQELIRSSISNQRVKQQQLVGSSFKSSGSSIIDDSGVRIPIDPGTSTTISAPDHPGNWVVRSRMNEDVGTVSVNITPGSTNTNIVDTSNLPSLLGGSGSWTEMTRDNSGNPSIAGPGTSLTRLLLLVLLIIIIIETILSRLFTHSSNKVVPRGAV